MTRTFSHIATVLLAAVLVVTTASVSAQERAPRRIRFAPGQTTAIMRGGVADPSDSDGYSIRVRAGQMLSVRLAGRNAVFSVSRPSGEVISGTEGVVKWSSKLSESGGYRINVGTESISGAEYTLKVTLR